jgi:ABC-2 type transport system ATP-binding protein
MKLELKNITKYYGNFKALDNFTLTLTPGVYGLLGPNGAGKTTLIKAIIGAHSINSGEILFNGVKTDDTILNHIGFLPQNPLLYDNYTAKEFLRYMCVLKGVKRQDINGKIDSILQQVNLKNDKKKISAYSGGMRQRLGIAQALINDPDILILDEPTAGLDPSERLRFRNIISKLSLNKIVLLATHIVSDVENIAKEIILLKEGVIKDVTSPEVLLEKISQYVWLVDDLTEAESAVLEEKYIVGNFNVKKSSISLRLISKDKPHPRAKPTAANLEDVYLYYFKGFDV